MLGAHDVPWIVKTANMEKFIPPWTVCRQMWSDSLKAGHSGILTDIMLFSDLNLSLAHHYRVHKHGLPHIAFRKVYLSKLRALLPVPVILPTEMVSPSVGLSDESPRRTRGAHRRIRLVRVISGSVSDLPILTLQDHADAQGAVVYDCRPPLLPVSLQLCDLGPLAGRRPEVSASVAVPAWVEEQSVGDVDADVVMFPELGVAPLIASGTDLEDELPTPADSPVSVAVRSAVAAVPEVCPVLKGGFDLELAKALLDVSVMPMMVTLIVDPVVDSMVSPAVYQVPPLPVVLVDEPVPRYRHHYRSPMFLGRRRPVWQRWTSTCHGLVPRLGGGGGSCRILLFCLDL